MRNSHRVNSTQFQPNGIGWHCNSIECSWSVSTEGKNALEKYASAVAVNIQSVAVKSNSLARALDVI